MENRKLSDAWITRALGHPQIQEALSAGRPVTTIKADSDLAGATTGQAHLLIRSIPDWTPAMTDAFTFCTNPVAMKLTALRYHLSRYREMQKVRNEDITSNDLVLDSLKKGLKFCELDMLFEVEAMFFQYKSALDMLVKVLAPITGKSFGSLSTYGKSGMDVIKALQQMKKNNKLKLTHGRVDWLVELIEKAKSPWLESVIRIRDTFSHYRTDFEFGFSWDSSLETVLLPQFQINDGFRQFDLVMEELVESLIAYCTDFIAIAVSCAVPLEQHIQVMSLNDRAYISARWNQDLSRARWKLASNINMIQEYSADDIERARQLAISEYL